LANSSIIVWGGDSQRIICGALLESGGLELRGVKRCRLGCQQSRPRDIPWRLAEPGYAPDYLSEASLKVRGDDLGIGYRLGPQPTLDRMSWNSFGKERILSGFRGTRKGLSVAGNAGLIGSRSASIDAIALDMPAASHAVAM
jgi:hypothetical protein